MFESEVYTTFPCELFCLDVDTGRIEELEGLVLRPQGWKEL
jgi:hypothetical protein